MISHIEKKSNAKGSFQLTALCKEHINKHHRQLHVSRKNVKAPMSKQ